LAAGAARRAVPRAAGAVRRLPLVAVFFGLARTVVDFFLALEAFLDD
jgi:hypothetical protein